MIFFYIFFVEKLGVQFEIDSTFVCTVYSSRTFPKSQFNNAKSGHKCFVQKVPFFASNSFSLQKFFVQRRTVNLTDSVSNQFSLAKHDLILDQ